MSLFEKITVGAILTVLTVSFSIYGVWEDKMTFLSILIAVGYTALAVWVALRSLGVPSGSGWWRVASGRGKAAKDRGQVSEIRDQNSDPISDVRPSTSDLRLPTSDLRSSTVHTPQFTGYSIPPGGIMLLLFWLFSAAMIPFSVIPYEAKISTLRFGCYVGTYWAIANICARFPDRKAVWTILFTAMLFVALYSLVQHQVSPEHVLWKLRYTSEYGRGFERLGGTYICPNHIAHLFQLWIPFCLVFLFIPQFGWFWRICFGYAVPVFSLLILKTYSRASLLGTVACLGALFLLVMLRRSRKAFVIALIAAPLLMAGGLGGLWFGSATFRERMEPVVRVAQKALSGDWEAAINLDGRPQMWADSLPMVKDRPWCGVGPGNYELTFPEYRHRILANKMLTVHPHNEPIELITEYGIVGTGLFLCAIVFFCVPLIRLVKHSDRLYHALPAAAMLAALAGTLVHGLFDFELRIFPNALMFAVLAGCAVAPLCGGRLRTEDGGRKTEDGRRRTEDGRRRTKDGLSCEASAKREGRRTEDGGLRTEDGGLKTED